jgi:hypothetical protein
MQCVLGQKLLLLGHKLERIQKCVENTQSAKIRIADNPNPREGHHGSVLASAENYDEKL